jgi:hypothetical protein
MQSRNIIRVYLIQRASTYLAAGNEHAQFLPKQLKRLVRHRAIVAILAGLLAVRAYDRLMLQRAVDVLDQPVEHPCLRQSYALDRRRRRLPVNPLTLGEKLGNTC